MAQHPTAAPATLLSLSPGDLETAREALAHGTPIAQAMLEAGTHAPALPASLRIAALHGELERAIQSSVAQGASAETVDALLAVAVHLSRRFPDMS